MRPSQEKVKKACRDAQVGKLMLDALYAHVSSVGLLPRVLQDMVHEAGEQNDLLQWNLIKVFRRLAWPQISLLSYPDFNTKGHPELAWSYIVRFLSDGGVSTTLMRWEDAKNRPILHRKELMVSANYHRYEEFYNLTESEEVAGLLAGRIGRRKQWEERLKKRGYGVRGHKLHRIKKS